MILGKKRYGNVPEVKIIHTMKRYGNVSEEEERPSLPDDIYCGLIETLSEKCFVTSLLEMWR